MLDTLTADTITRFIRRILAGKKTRFEFHGNATLPIAGPKETSIYIHIPFCKQLCPYCPYNRIEYEETLATKYIIALFSEIETYSSLLNRTKITSVYFGGGTPTVIGTDLARIIDELKSHFNIQGPICLETNPLDITSEKILLCKESGVEAVSLGIQSYQPHILKMIGRYYSMEQIENALQLISDAGIPTLNIDLMFALPGQTPEEFLLDLKTAISSGADQITAYPLFTFPYSSIGRYRHLKSIKMPPLQIRRRMYYDMYDLLTSQNYKRVSVWSFKKSGESHRYSSVTRERYIGLGAGAGTYWEDKFTLNTFDVNEYIRNVSESGHALALEMFFSKRLSVLHDFYWRLYDTYIPKHRDLEYCSYSVDDIPWLRRIILLSRIFGFITDEGHKYALTRSGSFWLHLLQNYFSLRYIDKIWSHAKTEAWPQIISF